MMIKFKFFQFEQVLDIIQIAGDEVIHTNYMITFFDKAVAKMWAEETGCTGNKYFFGLHAILIYGGPSYTFIMKTQLPDRGQFKKIPSIEDNFVFQAGYNL